MRVLIVDDHELVRRGIRAFLGSHSHWEVCGEAVNGVDALAKAQELNPDIVVMDISMPEMNGLEATRRLRTQQAKTEVLILSQHSSAEMARQALQAGARGYVVKGSVGRDLLNALQKVSRHELFFDPVVIGGNTEPAASLQEIASRSAILEQALRESEELFRSTFELAPIGVAHLDPQGNFIRVNRKLAEILGYTSEELLQLNYQHVTHPADLAAETQEISRLLHGKSQEESTERRFIGKNGGSVWVMRTASAVTDTNTRLKHIIFIVEDITERKKAELDRFRLAAIVESSDDGIISKNLDGVINSWNVGAERIFGYTAQEAVGHHITLIIPPELHPEETGILKRLRAGERIEHFETTRVTKSGRRVQVSLTISPMRDSRGRIIGASKIARDITERKRVETALQESEQRLRGAFTQSYAYMLLLSLDGTILEVNQAALDAAGKTRQQVIGTKLWDPWWGNLPHELAKLKKHITLAAQGEAVREECQYQMHDGTLRFALRTINPVKNDQGKVVLLVASGLDITEQKELRESLENRVRARTADLERKNVEIQMQSDVVRELSARLLQSQDEERRRIARELHDSAGQILTALQINLVSTEPYYPSLPEDVSRSIKESLELVNQLSREVRTLSYLLHPPLLDESGLPSAIEWYVEGFATRSGIGTQLEISRELGRLPRDMETTIFRIVQECLTNIHRHSGSPSAYICVERDSREVRVEVRDRGRGINPRKGSPSKTRPGVGLRGMQERVHQFGGVLTIQSDSSGTTVTASLPLPENAGSRSESIEAAPVQ